MTQQDTSKPGQKPPLGVIPIQPQVDEKSPTRGLEQKGRAPDPCPGHHLS